MIACSALGVGVHVAGDRRPGPHGRRTATTRTSPAPPTTSSTTDDDRDHPLQPLAALRTLDRERAARASAARCRGAGRGRTRASAASPVVVVLDEDDRAAAVGVEAALHVDGVGQVVVVDRDQPVDRPRVRGTARRRERRRDRGSVDIEVAADDRRARRSASAVLGERRPARGGRRRPVAAIAPVPPSRSRDRRRSARSARSARRLGARPDRPGRLAPTGSSGSRSPLDRARRRRRRGARGRRRPVRRRSRTPAQLVERGVGSGSRSGVGRRMSGMRSSALVTRRHQPVIERQRVGVVEADQANLAAQPVAGRLGHPLREQPRSRRAHRRPCRRRRPGRSWRASRTPTPIPIRKPRRPSESIRPPAVTSPGTGLTNTEPQF